MKYTHDIEYIKTLYISLPNLGSFRLNEQSGPETEIFQNDYVKTITGDAPVYGGARSLPAFVLNMQGRWVLIFHGQ